ncbi:FAD-dependent oxidoreductase [Arthrobacter echini]|uniref:FAD-dependent oxidoreductase n=1 Tax=Arthrobacter echini TaxID=1529066 RepID=A0A5D0XRY0_9MICC|nr:FAD-dependent oxidoreductase [Arthrobacter echini]TYC99159.1 FAD-dependent oxidoreductase [Arthrobacter echini]
MQDSTDPTSSLASASTTPFWLDDPNRPEALPPLSGSSTTDLVIVGGGYTGLWTALLAKEREPDRRVMLLEGQRLGWSASGRNGGFCDFSLTHGEGNGQKHLPEENELLTRMGLQNLDEIQEAVERYGLDCEFERTGEMNVATEDYQIPELAAGHDPDADAYFMDAAELAEHIVSPTFKAGLWTKRSTAMLHPAKLVWELARVARELGVEIHEHTPVRSLSRRNGHMVLRTDGGDVTASQVALATNAFPSLLRRMRWHTVPVYDYALMTEPLSDAQLESIGWSERFGMADLANRFHYYRLTADNRILWGGWDAVYYYGRTLKREYDQRPETFETLARQFHETFPQLGTVRFTHKWGGAVDTCSRFFPFFTTAYSGRVVYTAGFTGLGVGATRFAGNVMLDLLSGASTERTELQMVKKTPLPFPPEPLAWAGIKVTTRAMIKSDQNEGKRGPLLKLLDAIGIGFDS